MRPSATSRSTTSISAASMPMRITGGTSLNLVSFVAIFRLWMRPGGPRPADKVLTAGQELVAPRGIAPRRDPGLDPDEGFLFRFHQREEMSACRSHAH